MGSILLVTDGRDPLRTRQLQTMTGCSVVDISDPDPQRMPAERVIVDIDLHNLQSVRLARRLVMGNTTGSRRFFLLDKSDHFETVQANALGADGLIDRTMPVTSIASLIGNGGGGRHSDAAGLGPAGVALDKGVATVDRLFEAVRTGAAIDLTQVRDASGNVLDAIERAGLANWLSALSQHHDGTYQHCLLVTGVCLQFASALGYSEADTLMLGEAGFLHDIGKANVPQDILEKPGKLTPAEYGMIQEHPMHGYRALASDKRVHRLLLAAVRSHHEFLDGSGYPDRLSGQTIPEFVQIVTVCDIFAALIEPRSYKSSMTFDEALGWLRQLGHLGKVSHTLVDLLDTSLKVVPETRAREGASLVPTGYAVRSLRGPQEH